jgi:hypothetical protein
VKQAVVIGTWPGAAEQLETLLRSLNGCRWPIYVVVNSARKADPIWLAELAEHYYVFVNQDQGYELEAFRTILERTDIDEFLFLQDSFEVLDQSFIDDVFARPESVALGPTFFHYAGKWKRSVLEKMVIPPSRSKIDSVRQEHQFSRRYWEREQVWVFDPHFHDGENAGFVEAYGRVNMLLANRWYRKLKGDWGQREIL